MKRYWLLAAVFLRASAYGQTYGRITPDFSLQNAQGQAISGASVCVYTEPFTGTQSNASCTAGTPATLYGSGSGTGAAICGTTSGQLSQPLKTDGFGHACAYAAPAFYAVCYWSPFTGGLCYQDQVAQTPSGLYLPLSGGTVAGAVNAANGPSGNLAQKRATNDAVYYVQLNSGSDSNDGLSPGSGFLTISRCVSTVAALANPGGRCMVSGSGTVNISSGITISQQYPFTLDIESAVNLNWTGTGCMITVAGGASANEPTTISGGTARAAIWSQTSNFGTTLSNATSGNQTICLTGSTSNVTIEGLTFSNSSGTEAIQFSPVANTSSSSGVTVQNNLFQGGTNALVEANTGGILQHLVIYRNDFKSQTSSPISLDFASGNAGNAITIAENWFISPGGSAIALGLSFNGTFTTVNILRNEIQGGTTINTYGVQGSIQGGTIEGNDCEIWNGASGQACLDVGGQGLTIGGNQVSGGCGTGAPGTFILDLVDSTVNSNRFSGTPSCTTGISLSGTSKHVTVDAQQIASPYTTDVSDGGTFDVVHHNGLGTSGDTLVFPGTLNLTGLGVARLTFGTSTGGNFEFNFTSPAVGDVVVVNTLPAGGNAGSLSNLSGTITGTTCSAFTHGVCTTAGLAHTQAVASLTAGTVTVSTAAACTPSSTCVYKLSNCGAGSSTAIGTPAIGTVTAGTSFVINSLSSTNATVTGDTSNVCWSIN